MKIVFRADASLQMGTGHVMRCLTLAEALRERGALCSFTCREEPGNLIDLIRRQNFDVVILPVKENKAIDWHSDAEHTKVGVGKTAIDWLVVDHYALDACWEAAMRPTCRKLMVIDDLADRPHDCDLLLDQNLGRKVTDYEQLVPVSCNTLLGTQYSLLRPEFARMRPYSLARRINPKLGEILVTMGGLDNDNVTCRVLEALGECRLPQDCKLTVVMGAQSPWIEQVRHHASILPISVELIVAPLGMADLMNNADLAIGAAGSTSWERCCVGLPSVLIVVAANQEFIARQLADSGAAKTARLESLATDLKSIIDQVQATPMMLQQMAESAASITNGTGAGLVSQRMSAAE